MTDKELLQVLLAAFDVDLITKYCHSNVDSKGRVVCTPLADQSVRSITMTTRGGDLIHICVGKKKE